MIAVLSGIGWVTPFSIGHGRDYKALINPDGKLPALKRKDVFEEPDSHFGRMDEYSKLGLAAIAFALKDADLHRWKVKRPVGIIASTVYGCLKTDIDYLNTMIPEGGLFASPNLFAYTLPNTFLGEASIRFGLSGMSFVVSEQSSLKLTPVSMALESVASGDMETMLAGICDLECPLQHKLIDQAVPGALFFVIEKNPRSTIPAYGKFDLGRMSEVVFRGVEVQDLTQLVHACLADHHHERLLI